VVRACHLLITDGRPALFLSQLTAICDTQFYLTLAFMSRTANGRLDRLTLMNDLPYAAYPRPFWFVSLELSAELLRAEIAKVGRLIGQHPDLRTIFDIPEATASQRALGFALLAHRGVIELINETFFSIYLEPPVLSPEQSEAIRQTDNLIPEDGPAWALEVKVAAELLPSRLFDALPANLQLRWFNRDDPTHMSSFESAGITSGTVENLQAFIERVITQQLERLAKRWATVTIPMVERPPATVAKKPKHWLKGTQGLARKADLSRYMQGLTEKQQLAASLKWEYLLGLGEIASRMGIDRKTAFEHIHAAKRKMEEGFSNEKHKVDGAKNTSEY